MTKALLRVLAGEVVWPPPIWLMRQAGRYLPEYRARRAQAGDFIQLCTTPALAAEVTLQPVHRFGLDAAILFSDILILPWALGQPLRFEEGLGPILDPIRDRAALDRLDPARLAAGVAPVIETVGRVRAGLPPWAALIGFAGGPWTVACYMIEGGTSREQAEARGLAYRDPALLDAMIELLTTATIDYLAAQAEAGAEVLMLFDSWAGALPPALFRALVVEPTTRIRAALRTRCPDVPVIGFPRLSGTLLADYAAAGLEAIGLDTSVDPVTARRLVPDGVALQGNLDPMALLAGGAALHGAAASVLAAVRGGPHVFNLGHGVLPGTDPAAVAALVQQVRDA